MTGSPIRGRLADIGLGCARLGEATGGVSWGTSLQMVRDAVDGGITFFDTADAYTNGTSERILGRALSGHRRRMTIATKAGYLFRPRSELEARARFVAGPIVQRLGQRAVTSTTAGGDKYAAQDFSTDYLRRALDDSLQRLRTSYVDLFQLHAPRSVDVTAVMELVGELIDAGKIRRFGIGVEELTEAEPWMDVDRLDSIQLPFSVIGPPAAGEVIDRARRQGISVIARSPLGTGLVSDAGQVDEQSPHGRLINELRTLATEAGCSVRDLAIDYARARDGVDVVVIGIRLPAHLADAVRAASRQQPDAELLSRVDAVVHQHRDSEGG